MDFLETYRQKTYWRIVSLLFFCGLLAAGTFYAGYTYLNLQTGAALAAGVSLVSILWAAKMLSSTVIRPLRVVSGALEHISPNQNAPAPDITKIKFGQELFSSLTNQIYQLASLAEESVSKHTSQIQDLHANFLANALPLPLVVLNNRDEIVYVNDAASKYFNTPQIDMAGQHVFTALDMSFANDTPLSDWLTTAKQTSVTSTRRWDRVRIGLPGQNASKQFDMAAHYNKANPMGYETLLIFFDHTEIYSQDDQAMSFVALTVHELRTPLTLLRGYIEVFDEEVGPTLEGEMKAFMQKMDAAAQQLSAFVDNILNVAKIEDNQLTLQLHKEAWKEVVETVIHDFSLRASVRGITIKTDIAENLPPVAVDRYSIYEVVANLLDNAIKYANGTDQVYISSRLDNEGMVETSVKDFGLGIDAPILPHIFDKFYRNHRNRAQIGGTGLGLFLSRAIVEAHGGRISANSKPGQGSTFTFTIIPYDKLSEVEKQNADRNMTRGAHGWIKNHSLIRR